MQSCNSDPRMKEWNRDASNFLSCLHIRQPFITAMRHPSSLLCREYQILPCVKPPSGSFVEAQPGPGFAQPLWRSSALAADYDGREGRKDDKKLYRCCLIGALRRYRTNIADKCSSLSNSNSYFQIQFIQLHP